MSLEVDSQDRWKAWSLGGVPRDAPGPEHESARDKEKDHGQSENVFLTVVTGWEQLLVALLANTQQFLHMEEQRTRLQQLLERARQLATERDLHAAAKQEASKELEAVLSEGRKLATFLRNGIKERYGNRSEKLVEFGVQPFRRRRKTGDTELPETKGASAPAPAKTIEV